MSTIAKNPTATALKKAFQKMGAPVKLTEGPTFRIDVVADQFAITLPPDTDVVVQEVQPKERHLMLVVPPTRPRFPATKLLCGHDERHWFAATLPNNRAVTGVQSARDSLKPRDVPDAGKQRNKRHNKAFKRQGEWFFVPAKNFEPDVNLILKNEPIRRNTMGSKAHYCEFLYRLPQGGRPMMEYRGMLYNSAEALKAAHPDADLSQARVRLMTGRAYVKGRITHPDHATLVLADWHIVYLNNEGSAGIAGLNAFVD